jgi:hypothetical protein
MANHSVSVDEVYSNNQGSPQGSSISRETVDTPTQGAQVLSSAISTISKSVSIPTIIIIFIIFMLVTSDIFSKYFLNYIPDTIHGSEITVYGTIIQGASLIVLYILVEVLMSKGIL